MESQGIQVTSFNRCYGSDVKKQNRIGLSFTSHSTSRILRKFTVRCALPLSCQARKYIQQQNVGQRC